MHYANGRAAKIGDLVRGKGYNVKHEIVGLLLSANAAAAACNCTVAHVGVSSPVSVARLAKLYNRAVRIFKCASLDDGSKEFIPTQVIASIEYGQLDAFVALDPLTGEVLPPVGALVEAATA